MRAGAAVRVVGHPDLTYRFPAVRAGSSELLTKCFKDRPLIGHILASP
jgi:hypothetical protein